MTDQLGIPSIDQPLTPNRLRTLGDALKVHGRTRRAGYDPAAVDPLIERAAAELERLIQAQAADQAAARTATDALKQWRANRPKDQLPQRPTSAEVQTLVNAQLQADRDIARARSLYGPTAVLPEIPPAPKPTGDPVDDLDARTDWVNTAAAVVDARARAVEEQQRAVEGRQRSVEEEGRAVGEQRAAILRLLDRVEAHVPGVRARLTGEIDLTATVEVTEVAS